MRYDHGQYSGFDGLDNRKTIYDLFRRMGRNLPDDLAGARRAGFLQGLLLISHNGFHGKSMLIEGLPTAGEAYSLFAAICGDGKVTLGVPIEQATILLEKVVRKYENVAYGAIL